MAWTWLLLAGCLEVACTTLYRYTGNITRLWPSVAFFLVGFASFYCLNRSLAAIPIGTAYAVWTGIGAAGTALVGIAFYGESGGPLQVALLSILIAAIVGLKLVSQN